jgi:hypothetical protein
MSASPRLVRRGQFDLVPPERFVRSAIASRR